MGTINYEVVCLIGKGVPRLYFEQVQKVTLAEKVDKVPN